MDENVFFLKHMFRKAVSENTTDENKRHENVAEAKIVYLKCNVSIIFWNVALVTENLLFMTIPNYFSVTSFSRRQTGNPESQKAAE